MVCIGFSYVSDARAQKPLDLYACLNHPQVTTLSPLSDILSVSRMFPLVCSQSRVFAANFEGKHGYVSRVNMVFLGEIVHII